MYAICLPYPSSIIIYHGLNELVRMSNEAISRKPSPSNRAFEDCAHFSLRIITTRRVKTGKQKKFRRIKLVVCTVYDERKSRKTDVEDLDDYYCRLREKAHGLRRPRSYNIVPVH